MLGVIFAFVFPHCWDKLAVSQLQGILRAQLYLEWVSWGMLCNQPQVSGVLETPVLGKLLVKQEIQNTSCIPNGLGHPTPMCPSAFHDQMDQSKGRKMLFFLNGVLLNGCAGVLAGAWSVSGLGSSLQGSACACHTTTPRLLGKHTPPLHLCSPLPAKACTSWHALAACWSASSAFSVVCFGLKVCSARSWSFANHKTGICYQPM